jgi:site-specific recombinase XerD
MKNPACAAVKREPIAKNLRKPRVSPKAAYRLAAALRKLRRESPTETYVFVTERGGPMSTIGFHHLIQRLGKAARMPFQPHPHMLRHACGYKLANDGHDTRALQHYLGHKNIQHTVRYTELSPDRFRDFWRD